MSRRDLHSDENFWPCVSDMFLALFVIALVLYSTMSVEKGRGDKYVSDLAAQEACSLFETLQREYPDSETIKGINVEEIRNEEHGARPKLAEALYGLLSCEETARYFYVTDDTLTKIPDASEMYRYNDAIALLYETRTECGAPPDENDPCYHEHMRKVREHVESEIYKSKSDSTYADASYEELVEEAERLDAQIRSMKTKDEYDALASKKQELFDKSEEVKQLQAQKEELEQQIAQFDEKLTHANTEGQKLNVQIAKLDEDINNIKKEDPRKDVMEEVQNKLNEDKYSALKGNGAVKVDVEKGIVIISSEVFAFDQATGDYYRQGRGVRPDDVEHRLEKPIDKYGDKLKLLAKFLIEIAQMVENGDLPVDSISIECHTDDDVGKVTDKVYFNDGLSLQRAFDVWLLLDKYAERALSKCKNLQGQRLFTMTGFGRRVLLTEIDGEDTEDYQKRCRRMQLRFNCIPPMSSSAPLPQKTPKRIRLYENK
ncbi:MAG: hypothetical protein E7031_01070 [Akkermansiaceae bacterium]|nr:hypothetical protein [Akkermansiaceae bacterium]